MIKVSIKIGQIWQHKRTGKQCTIFGKRRGKWAVLIISPHKATDRNHALSNQTLWSKFNLVK